MVSFAPTLSPQSSPAALTVTGCAVAPLPLPTLSIFFTTSMPAVTCGDPQSLEWACDALAMPTRRRAGLVEPECGTVADLAKDAMLAVEERRVRRADEELRPSATSEQR